MLRKQGKLYTEKLTSYLGQNPTKSYPDFDTFTGSNHPPSAEGLRNLYKDAEYSFLQPYGVSNVTRYRRELQQVTVDESEMVAFDHTFQALKSYNLPGAKAIFTGVKGTTKELIALAITPSTSLSDASHFIQTAIKKRRKFRPKTVYTDTCPHGESYWKQLFGDETEGRLGLFHFLQRIIKTFSKECERDVFWEVLCKLQDAIYSYHEDDYGRLLEALKSGTFDKHKYSDEEIEQLRHSKSWKPRFVPYLRKVFHHPAVAESLLKRLISTYKYKSDTKGTFLFTSKTEEVICEEIKKLKHVLDTERDVPYFEIPPSKNSTHGLSKWGSTRPESALEKFHELLAHFANGNCRPELADAIILRGAAEYNARQRWIADCRRDRRENTQSVTRKRFQDTRPPFLNHLYLDWLNCQARRLGLTEPFENVHRPEEDNGEVFINIFS